VFKNEWLELKQDTLRLDKDASYVYTYIKRLHSGVMVVPYFTDTNSLLLVSQYRHPVGKIAWGFPGGGIEKGQSAQECARAELLEEAGYQVKQLIDLGQYLPDMGVIGNTGGRVFLGLDPVKATKPSQATDEEFTSPQLFSLEEVKQMIWEGEIRDGWSLGPFSLFLLWLEKHGTKVKHGKSS
jgi:ADP-ribose pyrophosphatase